MSRFFPAGFSADGGRLYATDESTGQLVTAPMPSGRLRAGVIIPGMMTCAPSFDETRLLVDYGAEGEASRSLGVLDMRTKSVIAKLGPMEENISHYAISRDNRWVFASTVGDTRLWDFGPQGKSIARPTTIPATRPATRPQPRGR